jgi:hypothetical protein
MRKDKLAMFRRLILGLKVGLVPVVVAGGMLVGPGGETKPEPVRAEPTSIIALNEPLCVALGSAFGGLPVLSSLSACRSIQLQANLQILATCIDGFDLNRDGVKECLDPGDTITGPAPPGDPRLNVDAPYRPTPATFAGLDLDKNLIYTAQFYDIILFVDDEFPVRFESDRGKFIRGDGGSSGAQSFCGPGGDFNDPDCDEDVNTKGDGVVAVRFVLDEFESGPDDYLETVHITAIQESIGFPVELTIVGTPDEIVLEPLLGKDTLQTGATPSTRAGQSLGGEPEQFLFEDSDPTDCNFAASVTGVLGAVNSPEKTVVVARALDQAGNEVAGALLNWRVFLPDEVGDDEGPGHTVDATFWSHSNPALRRKEFQGGVALPQTPTVDTGAIGVSFPQFICGGEQTGDLILEAFFDGTLSPGNPLERERITLKVIGPATDIALTAEPASLDCNGTNTSTVKATITNAAGDPVANGLDVHFETLALATTSPLLADSGAGTASTVVTPLQGANSVTADGGPAGVTLRVWVEGQIDEKPVGFEPHQEFEIIEDSILIACSGGPPPPGTGAGAGAGGTPTGPIRPPDTGSGGGATAGLPLAALAALAAAGAALAAGSLAYRRSR